jgi:5-formyltetrahydrofolate cyclo-ligase
VGADKAEWRRQLAAARRALTAAEVATARSAIRDHVLEMCRQQGWARVGAYVPFGTEPGSPELLAELDAAAAEVLVPVVLPDRDLDWARWHRGRTGPAVGPQAIASVDAALVPALAVAEDGTRLGRGGGSYDRALARLPAGTVVAALLYEAEVVPQLPRAPWDRPVSAVVTPSGWRELG